MAKFYRVRLGKSNVHAEACFEGGFVGTDFDLYIDLTGNLPDEWRRFNEEFIPKFIEKEPDRSRISAGLACGAIWTVSKGMQNGDVILCPDGKGRYRVGEVDGDYYYKGDAILHHRRPITWNDKYINRSDMSEELRKSTDSTLTAINISKYSDEIESFLVGTGKPKLSTTDELIEDPTAFAMESHLEDFLIANWKQTELGQNYDIYEEEGELVGKQYQTDTGPMDILAVSKDNSTLLVVELKKGRASDAVVGQTLRYMGYVSEVLSEENQKVKGLIIALSDDKRLQRALIPLNGSIEFYRYEINFSLKKIE